MAKVRLLVRIVSITVVTIFLMVCITAGILLLIYHFAPEKFFECYDSGRDLYAAARYYCLPHPPSENWIECSKTKYVWRYLRNEKVKRIAFGRVNDSKANLPDNWGCEIVEPEKINQTLLLINKAKKDINVSIVWLSRMIIITDEHKFIIPVEVGEDAVYSLDWTSKELRKQLWKWGCDHKVYKYDLPSKEQVVAILLYPPEDSLPLAIFGDKKLAEEILFEFREVNETEHIKGMEKLYKLAKLRQFGVKIRKEGKEVVASNELEPRKIFRGREWMEKIIDAYEIAFKEAENGGKYFPMELDNPVGRIVFMTQDKDYWKEIGIDANAVFDDYIKSELLKKYFDELGLTGELSVTNPNKITQTDRLVGF